MYKDVKIWLTLLADIDGVRQKITLEKTTTLQNIPQLHSEIVLNDFVETGTVTRIFYTLEGVLDGLELSEDSEGHPARLFDSGPSALAMFQQQGWSVLYTDTI